MQIIIDGFDITDYIKFQGLKRSRNDVDGPNAGRNLAGRMIRDRVATKIRWDVSCRMLTDTEHTALLNAIAPEYISVYIDDPRYGTYSTVMYSNNNTSEYGILRDDGTEMWDNVSFPLVEV